MPIISKYLNEISFKDRVILISGRTLQVMGIDRDKWYNIKKGIENSEPVGNIFEKKGFIVDDCFDEKRALKEYIDGYKKWMLKDDEDIFNDFVLTLNNDCNLDCIYCCIKKEEKIVDDKTIEEAIIQFHKNFMEKKLVKANFSITGGEPFLYPGKIRFVLDNLKRLFKSNLEKLQLRIITNGTIYNEEIVKGNSIILQITLDGPEDIHNKRRPYKSGKGSYSRVIDNIKKYKKHCRVNIRMNTDKSNYDSIEMFLNDIKELIDERISFSFVRTWPYNGYNAVNLYSDHDKVLQKFNAFVRENHLTVCNKTLDFDPLSESLKGQLFCGICSGKRAFLNPYGEWIPCIVLQERKYALGNLTEGIDIHKAEKFLLYEESCLNCKKARLCISYFRCPKVIIKGEPINSPYCNDDEFKYFVEKFARSANLL